MEFVKALVERDFGMDRMHDNMNYRQFEPIRIGPNLWLSIQASYGHYCKPRKTVRDLNEYTHWEFALFNKDDFVRVADVLPNFASLAEIEYYEQSVYAYVPADLVEELYVALKPLIIFGLK